MTSQPWIRLIHKMRSPRQAFRPLQWSHDLPAMDTCSADFAERRRINVQTFNGAMTSQPWIRRIFRIFRPNGTVRACDSSVQCTFHRPTVSLPLDNSTFLASNRASATPSKNTAPDLSHPGGKLNCPSPAQFATACSHDQCLPLLRLGLPSQCTHYVPTPSLLWDQYR